jgi:hypothetical protein
MKKAIIVGGSMAGMLVGNMLIRQGWDLEILERSREGLEARGAGIVPQRSALSRFAIGRSERRCLSVACSRVPTVPCTAASKKSICAYLPIRSLQGLGIL